MIVVMTTSEAPPRRRIGTAVCGAALGLLVAFMLVRSFGLDSGTVLAIPIAAFPYSAVGAVVLPGVLVALRFRRMALIACVLLVVQLVWLVPRFVPDEVAATGPRLRVATSNAYVGRVDPKALVDLVREQRVDVLAVEELTPEGVRALEAAGLHQLMPFRELHPEVDSSIYSRLPLSRAGLLDRPTTWPQVTAEVTVGDRTVRLVAVHTYFPVGDPLRWKEDLEALRTEAGPDVVLLGDFNATLDHAPMRSLLDAGLVDTHAELGRWAPTWPADKIALIQLDHVLHGSGLAAVDASEHTLPGTDHRAVVAELVLRG